MEGSDQGNARPLQDRGLQILRKPSERYSIIFNPEMILLRPKNVFILEIYPIK